LILFYIIKKFIKFSRTKKTTYTWYVAKHRIAIKQDKQAKPNASRLNFLFNSKIGHKYRWQFYPMFGTYNNIEIFKDLSTKKY